MDTLDPRGVSRRGVLAGSGALILSFSLGRALAQSETMPEAEPQNAGRQPTPAKDLPGSLKTSPKLDAWIRVDADGTVTVFTGKAELGQGIRTALMQIAAEELEVPFESLKLVTPDSKLTPNEG